MDDITVTVVSLEGIELTSKMLTPNFADFIAKETLIYETLLKSKAIKDYSITATNDSMPVTITIKSKQKVE